MKNEIYTHIQAMKKIVESYTIKIAVEYGSGNISTPFFLNECQDLIRLTSIETQPEWAEKIKKQISDSRWELFLVKDNHDAQKRLANISPPQLVLLDSPSAVERIEQARMSVDVPFIVLHDSDRVSNYKKYIHPLFEYIHTITIIENNPSINKRGWLTIPSTTIFSNLIKLTEIFE